ncbi:MAG: VOC family protein [Ancrocorticia sp.]|uniref:VOC family protein n=1 Tax=Ancrocorticia sp. TaxID=2593684 RepID=UPI003F913761
MPVDQRIIPNIWYNGNAEAAAAFYATAIPFASAEVESRYPLDGLPEFQEHLAGAPLVVALKLHRIRLTLINAGPEFRPNPSISFMLNFDPLLFEDGSNLPKVAMGAARESLTNTWNNLSEGGIVRMELGEYPFAKLHGWVEDRFGVNWQLMLTDPEGEPRPFLIPSLLFTHEAQDKAAEASDFYVSLFRESRGRSGIGLRYPYGVPTGPASAEALAFGEFRIGNQWFVGNDDGAGHDFTFSEGVSLEVQCGDQAEIDRLWEALSAVPEAEECGWLKDRYGVSWQVVPDNLAELMERPDAYHHMLSMKKLIIDDF